MMNSKLSEHQRFKKELITPFNRHFGNMVEFKSWYNDRMPEFLWLAIIINKYGHINGLEKCHRIIEFIKIKQIKLPILTLSSILKLTKENKEILFEYINHITEDKVFDCLCVTLDDDIFRKYFYDINQNNNGRVNELKSIVENTFFNSSNLACDVRFFICYYLVYIGKMKIFNNCVGIIEMFNNYYKLEHTENIMAMYKSGIRSMENVVSGLFIKTNYPKAFWELVESFDDCDPYYLDFKRGDVLFTKELFNDVNREIINLIENNSDKKNNDKFIVMTGMINYCLKLLKDVTDNELHNSPSARILLRTIIETYVNLKYLILLSSANLDIWKQYKEYGLSKYKLIYKKASEKYIINEESHLSPKLLELLVNDEFDEEFMNIDLGYFSDISISKRFAAVEEKELYDTIYDYDVSYSHAHWGAIRETSMLKCDNSLHKYHIVTDDKFQQFCKSTHYDYIVIFAKICELVSKEFSGISDEFISKYIEYINA